ncbi:hypothetical protein STXM2123_5572 [Streptomyces sp. F-3]|nr:hypothetical protein STXM2123_5572 [Streptomyces sp. F-3]
MRSFVHRPGTSCDRRPERRGVGRNTAVREKAQVSPCGRGTEEGAFRAYTARAPIGGRSVRNLPLLN